MKQMMIDMMAAMMPYMRPVALGAAALLLLGLVLAVMGKRGGIVRTAGTIGVAAGVFFLACEAAGRVLGFEPTVLFASPMDRVMYRNQWPFWTLGLALFLVGSIVRRLAGAR